MYHSQLTWHFILCIPLPPPQPEPMLLEVREFASTGSVTQRVLEKYLLAECIMQIYFHNSAKTQLTFTIILLVKIKNKIWGEKKP